MQYAHCLTVGLNTDDPIPNPFCNIYPPPPPRFKCCSLIHLSTFENRSVLKQFAGMNCRTIVEEPTYMSSIVYLCHSFFYKCRYVHSECGDTSSCRLYLWLILALSWSGLVRVCPLHASIQRDINWIVYLYSCSHGWDRCWQREE